VVSLTLTTAADYKYVVNREAVRVYSRLGIIQGVVADAKRLMQGKRERQPSEGQYIGLACDWRLPGCEVVTEIVPGCFIVDSAGISYVVLSVDPPGTYQGTYNCSCIALMVVGHTITWHLPTVQTDSYGSPLVDTSATLPAQLCAIQEMACEEVLFQGVVQGFRRTYLIWIMGDVTLSFGATGIDGTGKVYTVKSVNTRDRLDELLCVEAVVEP
jgi:hypothetical protein